MIRRLAVTSVVAVALVLTVGGLPSTVAAEVRVGVNIGVPPVFVAPPPPVVVAPPPPVLVAPGVPVYYYGTGYYTYYNGAWFVGPGYGGPWAFVPGARVPRAIVGVPHAYHRIPPGHGRHYAGPAPWHDQRR